MNHFLQMLLENPGDESVRQIWADSLEEQGNAVDAGRLRQSGQIMLIHGNVNLAFWNSLDAVFFLGFTNETPICKSCTVPIPAAYSVDNDWYCTRCYIKSKTPIPCEECGEPATFSNGKHWLCNKAKKP